MRPIYLAASREVSLHTRMYTSRAEIFRAQSYRV